MKSLISLQSNSIFRIILKYFLPEICPSCQNNLSKNNLFCTECLHKILLSNHEVCKSCGGKLDLVLDICSKCMREEAFPWNKGISVFIMNNFVQHLIEQYKYNNKIEFLTQFSFFASQKITDSKLSFDCITPIPLHYMKHFYRGYNQSALLAKQLALLSNIPYKNLIIRKKFTKTQTKLSGKERHKNLKGVFFVKEQAFIEKKDILLIDDIFTTGSTLRAASEVLLSAGANKVTILVLARR